MSQYYDDNYGNWEDMDDPDMQDFYEKTQRQSIRKKCVDCGRWVNIKPDYECCNSCADRREGTGY
jgi:hypothetical protein